jgi:nitric oxide reductase NorQ protein
MPDFIDESEVVPRLARLMAAGTPTLLTGPTGCGKTTAVYAVASALGRPVVDIVGHQAISAAELVGTFLLSREGTHFQSGPLLRAMTAGAVFYFDEMNGVPEEVLKVLYPALDHRRAVTPPLTGTTVTAASGFCFVGAYNPLSHGRRALPPAFRQRCAFLRFDYLSMGAESSLLVARTGIDAETARRLVTASMATREAKGPDALEMLGTRPLLQAAEQIVAGASFEEAVEMCLIGTLTDDPKRRDALREVMLEPALGPGLSAAEDESTFEFDPEDEP